MPRAENKLVWSFSRMRQFDACKRQYYYNYYLSRGGFSLEASEERQTAYRLKQMRSIAVVAGDIVHEGIADALVRYRQQIPTSLDDSLDIARRRWEWTVRQSESGGWRENPRGCVCLFEQYYQFDDMQRRLDSGWNKIEVCLRNFHLSPSWQVLQRTKPSSWLATDKKSFSTTQIEGIPAIVRPDLGYGMSRQGIARGACRVFDWKTGKPQDYHRNQVRYYALYAENGWGFPVNSVTAHLIYLYPELDEQEVEATPEMVEQGRQELRNSYAAMRAVLADADANEPYDITRYPVTTRTHLCRYCPFQEICHDRLTHAVTAGDADSWDDELSALFE